MVFCACLGDSECGGEHCIGEEILEEVPLGDSSDTDLSEDEPPGDLSATPADAIVPAEAGTRPPPCTHFLCGDVFGSVDRKRHTKTVAFRWNA